MPRKYDSLVLDQAGHLGISTVPAALPHCDVHNSRTPTHSPRTVIMVEGNCICASVNLLTKTIIELHPPKNRIVGHTLNSAVAVRARKKMGKVL